MSDVGQLNSVAKIVKKLLHKVVEYLDQFKLAFFMLVAHLHLK